MSDEEHNKQLVESLENALSADKATCHVAPMSQFGLVEFTRKRVCPSPVALMKKPCSRCHGIGYTRSTEFILFDVRARLLEILHNGNKVVCVDMEFNLAHEFLAWQSMIDSIKAYYPDAKIYVTPQRGRDEENITYSTAPIPQNATALF
jgi:Ribonuclease G/E